MNQKARIQARSALDRANLRFEEAKDNYRFSAVESVLVEAMLEDYPNQEQDEQRLIQLRFDDRKFSDREEADREELRCACLQWHSAKRRLKASYERAAAESTVKVV